MRATAILGDVAHIVHPVEGTFDLSGYENVVDAVVRIVTRHPMRQEELEWTLARWTPGQVDKALADLEASGRVQVVERLGDQFWSAGHIYYPDELHSQVTAPNRRNHHSARSREVDQR
jgi:hypothetical protein